MADVEEGEYALVCVCNSKGEILWLDATQVSIVSIDGQNVQELAIE